MQNLTVKLTVEELRLVATLASDQLFRREFIDPKMPGFKPNPDEVGIGKALVVRFRVMIDQATRNTIQALATVPGHGLGIPSKP
jgi:hypothetical protein